MCTCITFLCSINLVFTLQWVTFISKLRRVLGLTSILRQSFFARFRGKNTWAGARHSAGRPKRKDTGSDPRFGSSFSSKIVMYANYGHCRDFAQHIINIIFIIKMAHIAAHLNEEIILVVTLTVYIAVRNMLPLPSYCWYHFCESDVKLRGKTDCLSWVPAKERSPLLGK